MADHTPRPLPGYRALARLAVPLAGRLLRGGAARAGHRGRLTAPAALHEWGNAHRDPTRPLVWIHAASVGEGLQAVAVLDALRTLRPDLQTVATHFSASSERIRELFRADFCGYIPYDRQRDVERTLTSVRPSLVVFCKLDLWPELATGVHRIGGQTALVAGTVDPGSRRLRWPSRVLTARGYETLDRIGVIDVGDDDRVVRLGAQRDRISVTGDPRVDSVLARLSNTVPGTGDPMLLVAGSTWRDDERHLLGAFQQIRKRHPDARLALVPHDPTDDAVAAIRTVAAALELPAVQAGNITAPLSVITEMGVLATLYAAAGLGYVGGGFGRRGIHSVLEPAAAGLPILIGPQDRGVRDSRLLASAGGLVRLSATAPVDSLTTQWGEWLADPERARRAGESSLRALSGDRGAALRSAQLLLDLL